MDGLVWIVKKAAWMTYRLVNSGFTLRRSERQKRKKQLQRGGGYQGRSEHGAASATAGPPFCTGIVLKWDMDI